MVKNLNHILQTMINVFHALRNSSNNLGGLNSSNLGVLNSDNLGVRSIGVLTMTI